MAHIIAERFDLRIDSEHLRTLLSPYPEAYARFGSDAAISGDVIVVGEEQSKKN